MESKVSVSFPTFSVIVANWEGEAWIERALSSIQLSSREAGGAKDIIVVDDASTDRSPRIVAERFPRVKLLRNEHNLGFGATVNRGVEASTGDIAVLLNNDLVVREEFMGRLLQSFVDDSEQRLFAVSARTLSWDGTEPNHVCMAGRFHSGRLQPVWSDPPESQPCLFAQGGAMACRRDLFLDLGGLDPIFAPGYWEDYDLCWQAAKAGFTIRFEPRALAYHVGGGSMVRRFGSREVYLTRARNHLLFEWINLSDRRLVLRHVVWLPVHVGREWAAGRGFGLTQAVARAAMRLPQVLERRIRRRARRIKLAHWYSLTNPAPPDSSLIEMGAHFSPSASP